MKRPVRPVLVLMALLLSLALAACGGAKSSTPGVTDQEIVLGTWGPMTGPAAAWGDVQRGIEAYAKYTNEQGGINGRKLKILIEDDQYQPSRTVAAAKKLVEQDKVFALVGVIGTSNLSAVQEYLMQNKVPVIMYSNGASKFQEPSVNPLLFAGLMQYEVEAKILAKYATDQLKIKKLAVFYQNDDFGKDGLKGARAAAQKLGAQIVTEVAYNPADVDVSAYVLKIKEAGAEGVLMWSTVKHGALMIKEGKKIGYTPKWLLSSVVAGTQLPELTEGSGEGALTVGYAANLTDKNHPVVKEFLEKRTKYMQGDPTQSQLTGWSFGRVAAEALKRAGKDLTREKLVKALETFKDFEGTAKITFTDKDHSGVRQGWVRELKGQNYVDVSKMIQIDF